jgi:thiamine biosynthesis lipoprotein
MKDYLTSAGVNSAIINLGGNVLLIGSKPDGSDFTVGIEKPFEGTASYAATVSLSDRSVVTSGVYERYFTVDDRIYHHILDPATGFPSDTGLYSVTILSDRSVDGDALSTSCFVLGRKKGMELIESLDNTEAVFITDKNEMIYSSGFPH